MSKFFIIKIIGAHSSIQYLWYAFKSRDCTSNSFLGKGLRFSASLDINEGSSQRTDTHGFPLLLNHACIS